MENRNLGILFIIISLVFLFFLISFNSNFSERSNSLGCNPSEECVKVDRTISMVNIGFGFFGFMLALGFYILFFNKSEERILKRLEENKNERTEEEKFNLILKALDPYEKQAMKTIKEQEGITQNVLRLRTNMSKAKLSYVLQDLEKRNLIKRIPKDKTLQVFLKI